MTPLPAELLAAFPCHERRIVRPPAEPAWADLDFLGWVHRSGHLGFVVVEQTTGLLGMVLERKVVRGRGTRRFMCDLCFTLHGQGGIASFTRWNRSRTSARTAMLCADLKCSAYIRGLRKNDCVQMAETLTRAQKIERLTDNLHRLAAFLDAVVAKPAAF